MEVCSRTDRGRIKETNQDFLFHSIDSIGQLQNLFIMADGMGGHNSGDIASKFTTEVFVADIKNFDEKIFDVSNLLCATIISVDKQLTKLAATAKEYSGMGTTLVVATIYDGDLVLGNVGDSRLYIYTDRLMQITEDHSEVMELVRSDVITLEEARSREDKNRITRAIGFGARPDIFIVPANNIKFIVLCTDGLTNMVRDEQITEVLENDDEIQKKCDTLIDLANSNGGVDNISVMIIQGGKR